MGLSGWVAALAVQRVHVLVVADPAAARLRIRLERAVQERGWVLALSPADADVLALCGVRPGSTTATDGESGDPQSDSGTDVISRAAAELWSAMAGPRARIDLSDEGDVEGALDRARDELLDATSQSRTAGARVRDGGEQLDLENHEDAGHEHVEMAPHGIALAEGTEDDRDGLEMDVLHVPLGPVLPHWPAGLVLHCTLHGDLVAEVDVVLPRVTAPVDTMPLGATYAEAVADVLALAGWPGGCRAALRARDAFTDGDHRAGAEICVALHRRVQRHRVLTWMVRGLGTLTAHDLAMLPGARRDLLAGDVHDRVLALLSAASNPTVRPDPVGGRDGAVIAELLIGLITGAVRGLEVGAARLAVASLALPGLLATLERADV